MKGLKSFLTLDQHLVDYLSKPDILPGLEGIGLVWSKDNVDLDEGAIMRMLEYRVGQDDFEVCGHWTTRWRRVAERYANADAADERTRNRSYAVVNLGIPVRVNTVRFTHFLSRRVIISHILSALAVYSSLSSNRGQFHSL